jgi:hypothetical protein
MAASVFFWIAKTISPFQSSKEVFLPKKIRLTSSLVMLDTGTSVFTMSTTSSAFEGTANSSTPSRMDRLNKMDFVKNNVTAPLKEILIFPVVFFLSYHWLMVK